MGGILFFSSCLLFIFFSLGHFKPHGGRNLSLCARQEWGEDWRCALRFREVLLYLASLGGTQGIAKWSSKSRVLTHSLFFGKNGTSEHTGMQSTELVVSFILYSCRNKPWYFIPGILPFKEPPGARYVLGIPDVNLFSWIHPWWYHSLGFSSSLLGKVFFFFKAFLWPHHFLSLLSSEYFSVMLELPSTNCKLAHGGNTIEVLTTPRLLPLASPSNPRLTRSSWSHRIL